MVAQANPPREAYVPYGAALELMHSQAGEVLLSGPAGTGKSIACLMKLHLLCEKAPNLRCLIIRKTRESLSNTGLVTFEQKVLPEGHPARQGPQRRLRQVYRYPHTGSEIEVGGIDKPGKIMSSEYDVVFVQEGIELKEEDWEALTTRLRNHKLPYQQLIADTNPDRPTHWLKARCDAGRTLMLHSRHEDNPAVYDRAKKCWTPRGAEYIAKLDKLTGHRKLRLRHGRWVQAEGAVYENWDAARHLIDRRILPYEWPRYLSVDFGYTNAFVAQWWCVDPDGRLILYREIYRTGTLVEEHARSIARICGAKLADGQPPDWSGARERPRAVVCDHDAEDRATLERHLGLPTTPAEKAVSPGLQAVQSRLNPDGTGVPRLMLFRDAPVSRDPSLIEAHKPSCTAEEFDGYRWADGRAREGPVKEDDHGLDALRYMVAELDLKRRRSANIW